MANKRDFRKYVTTVVNNICQDMMIAYYNIDNANKTAIDDAVIEVLKAGELALSHSNVMFDKTAKAYSNKREYNTEKAKFNRALYSRINKEFFENLNLGLKKFNAAIPQEVKEANK